MRACRRALLERAKAKALAATERRQRREAADAEGDEQPPAPVAKKAALPAAARGERGETPPGLGADFSFPRLTPGYTLPVWPTHPPLGPQLPAPGTRLWAPSFRLPAPGAQLSACSVRLSAFRRRPPQTCRAGVYLSGASSQRLASRTGS